MFVIGVDLESLVDVELARCVLLLDELRCCQIVEGLIVAWIQTNGLFVVHGCFLRNAQREVGIGQILVEVVFATVFEAFLQDHYGLGVTAQHVQSSCSVIVQVKSHLELLSFVLDFEQNALAYFQTLLGPATLEIQVRKVLSS